MRLCGGDGSLNGKVLREVVGRLKERMEFRGGWRVTLGWACGGRGVKGRYRRGGVEWY